LDDGALVLDRSIPTADALADPVGFARMLSELGADLIAGPSGYGLPLTTVAAADDRALRLAYLAAPGEHGGIGGLRALAAAMVHAQLPVVFTPGVIHLPSVPAHRKINRIDLGTADKLCVAALALAQRTRQLDLDFSAYHGCAVELGSSFTACLVLNGGCLVDGLGGTSGPPGWRGGGAWDGELAYLLSPLQKRDLFVSGVASVPDTAARRQIFR